MRLSSPPSSAADIAEDKPGTAEHDAPAAHGQQDGDQRPQPCRKTMLRFARDIRLFHPPAQIGAQAPSRGIDRTDRQEGRTKRPVALILSGPVIGLFRRTFHIIRCSCKSGRGQVAFDLVLMPSEHRSAPRRAATRLRRPYHRLRRTERHSSGGQFLSRRTEGTSAARQDLPSSGRTFA